MRPVFPRALEANAHAAVGMLFEALKGERRSRDVATRDSLTTALEALSVATVHRDGGVDVDAADFCDGARPASLHEAKGTHELVGLTASAGAKQLEVGGRRAITRREHRLVAGERVSVGLDAIEASAVALQHSEPLRVYGADPLSDQ